ncbi:MAG: ATPase with chaperone activity [Rubrivivax sp.]|nr:ATPase with chaperone activity [Rubrivivax sp.]
MSDESQILVPPSFVALYLAPGKNRPSAPRAEIAARHEFCEDLATMLTEHAANKRWELGITEADVLERVHRGLLVEEAPVSAAEARWVIRRLAELLDWEALAFGADSGSAEGST